MRFEPMGRDESTLKAGMREAVRGRGAAGIALLAASREDREEYCDIAVVVRVAVDRDEVADAVFGRKRGIVPLELAVLIRESIQADHVTKVFALADQPSWRGVLRRRPIAAIEHPAPGLWPSDGAELPVNSAWVWPLLIETECERRLTICGP
jgi:hypothetical protein